MCRHKYSLWNEWKISEKITNVLPTIFPNMKKKECASTVDAGWTLKPDPSKMRSMIANNFISTRVIEHVSGSVAAAADADARISFSNDLNFKYCKLTKRINVKRRYRSRSPPREWTWERKAHERWNDRDERDGTRAETTTTYRNNTDHGNSDKDDFDNGKN